VLTADAQIFPRGAAGICGCGRTGSLHSVGGLDREVEIRKFLTQIPERSKDAWDNLELQGAIFVVNDDGRTGGIETLRYPVTEVPHVRDRQSNED
jgi:calcineurin-like phosphoesterase